MRPCLLLLGLAALPLVACDEDLTGPASDNLEVSVTTSGVDQDTDYLVRAGGGPATPVGESVLLSLPLGEHEVVLEDVAANCTLVGPASVRVTIVRDEVASATFHVECRAVTGAIRVAAPTVGEDIDPDGYAVRLGGEPRARVSAGSHVVIEGLVPGTYDVSLDDLRENCGLSAPPTLTVQVTAGGLTRDTAFITFEVSCQRFTGDVRLLLATGGADTDPNGYTLMLDGQFVTEPCDAFYCCYYWYECPVMLPPSGNQEFQVPPGSHTYELGDVAPNCTVNGEHPREVVVAFGETSIVQFEVTCHAFAEVEIVTTTAGANPDPNGYTVRVDGQVVFTPCGLYECPLMLGPDGSHTFGQVPPGEHTYELGDIEPNCAVQGSNPRTVSVTPGEAAVVLFDLACTDVP